MPACPSCQAAVPEALAVCPSCNWRFNSSGATLGRTMIRPAVRPKIQCEVDLYVTIDRTGSSERFRTGIPQTLEIIVVQLQSKARRLTVTLASHGDLDDNQQTVIHTDAGTPEQAVQDAKNITFGGGGDIPESHLDAIEYALTHMPWSADPSRCRGAILAFMTADSKPARSGVTAAQIGQRIQAKGLLLYLVCEPTPTLYELVAAANGLMFDITNNPDPSELQKIAAQLAASIAASVASGSTIPMSVPIP
jgi:hypothetical protein